MSSLGDIRSPSAENNIANTFYVYSLNANFIEVGELIVDGDLHVLGNLDVLGTITGHTTGTIISSNPKIFITNTLGNTNRATLQLLGDAKTPILPVNIQQASDGTTYIENFQPSADITLLTKVVGNINLTPASGTSNIKNSLLTGTGVNASSVPYLNTANLVQTRTLTNGQLLVGSTGADPVGANISGSTSVSVTNGAGTIALSLPNFVFLTSTTNILQFGGFSVGITGTSTFTYTRTGNIITWNLVILLSNKGSSTGAATITLPIVSNATSSTIIASLNNISDPSAGGLRSMCLNFNTGSSIAAFQANIYSGGNIIIAGVTDANFQNTTQLYASGIYIS